MLRKARKMRVAYKNPSKIERTYSFNRPDILKVLKHEGIEVTQKGKYFWGLCPLPDHSEKTPSFKVDHEKGSFYCFGCNKHGDAITIIMERHALSFKQARAFLGIKSRNTNPELDKSAIDRKNLIAAFRAWEQETRDSIAQFLRAARKVLANIHQLNSENIEKLSDIIHEFDYMVNKYEILCGKDDFLKFELFKQEQNFGND